MGERKGQPEQEKPGEDAGPGSGNSLEDAADEAAREMDKRRDGEGHAGAGDIG